MATPSKRITKKNETNTAPGEAPESAPFTVGKAASPEFLKAHGIGPRDVALLEKYANAMRLAQDALTNSSPTKARRAYAELGNLARDAEKVRLVIRRMAAPMRVTEA